MVQHNTHKGLATSLRTHTCGQLRIGDNNNEAKLCGWVQSRRDHGGIIFVDLRDRDGITQIVFDPKSTGKESVELSQTLRREDCIRVIGKVRPRGQGLENPRIQTGQIEIIAEKLEILNRSETPPFEIEDKEQLNDDVRLEYRYLDLRRPMMQERLRKRSLAAIAVRKYFTEEGFLEIETPILMKSTPEGARDYVVPSRVNAGEFYALPQSPQLYKQTLMVSGCDRYFQIARCFRDEDLRADRQPEFTQVDVEMTFVTQDDVFKAIEGAVKAISDALGRPCHIPFPRMTYKDVMDKYSIDKPDMRFDMFTHDITHIASKADFSVFKNVISAGGIVKCINPEKDFSRAELDSYVAYAQSLGAKGMAWMRVQGGKLESNIAKYFSDAVQKELVQFLGAKDGSTIMCIADVKEVCVEVVGKLRLKVGDEMGLIDKNKFNWLWVVDFPSFEKNPESPTGWAPAHHMFTSPKKECLPFLKERPGDVYADCYDLVLNGVELGSGSIRINRPDIQKTVMEIVGYPEKLAEERFGFILKAFKYGAPPHGGFAIGFDRIVALMCGTNDIREVIAFPKNKSAQCPMDNCPSPITPHQLKELHIATTVAKKQ